MTLNMSCGAAGIAETCSGPAESRSHCGPRWAMNTRSNGTVRTTMTLIFNRREALALAAGAAGAVALGAPQASAKNDADEAIKKFTGGKTPTEGKVKLDLPEIAENGNTVPMTVTVESPMTEQSYVRSEEN